MFTDFKLWYALTPANMANPLDCQETHINEIGTLDNGIQGSSCLLQSQRSEATFLHICSTMPLHTLAAREPGMGAHPGQMAGLLDLTPSHGCTPRPLGTPVQCDPFPHLLKPS